MWIKFSVIRRDPLLSIFFHQSGGIRYAKEDPEQRNKYEELVAMKRYHRRYGQVVEK